MADNADGLVVVGSGPAGHAAATAYRDAGGQDRVRIVSADEDLPYQRPPLSKDFLRGEVDGGGFPIDEQASYDDLGIELTLGQRVQELDAPGHAVTTETGEVLGFAACVLATGSEALSLPVPGGDHPDVLRLRSLADGRRLRRAADAAESAIVVGSGFIGCEAAVSLAMRGLSVTMLSAEGQPQVERLGSAAAGRLAGWLAEAGVRLIGGAQVESISGGHTVRLEGGVQHTADLVLTAVGVGPQAGLAAAAGLRCEQGRVVVDEHMRTSAVDVYAAGDVAFAHNAAAGRHLGVEHWGEALAMGQIAGSCAAGREATWGQAPGFWSEIGERTLKYAAWGDGYDDARLVDEADGAFTVWYTQRGVVVGVLTHDRDTDYERGASLVEEGSPAPP